MGCKVASARTAASSGNAASFLAGYEASDVGGDVPLMKKVRRATGLHGVRGHEPVEYACSPSMMASGSSCASTSLPWPFLWHDSFDGSSGSPRGLQRITGGQTKKKGIIDDRPGPHLFFLLRKAHEKLEARAPPKLSRISPGSPRTLGYPVVGTFGLHGTVVGGETRVNHAALR